MGLTQSRAAIGTLPWRLLDFTCTVVEADGIVGITEEMLWGSLLSIYITESLQDRMVASR